ncbi:MAG TPA: hypothetical protein VLQ93_00970 [Myxococcaceae bacterium]|nr:hypothetical protein [Myxococcaceae bacterium]
MLHVASGNATIVRIAGLGESVPLELPENGDLLQFLPLSPSAFVLVPSEEFTVGERLLLTVNRGAEALTLTLVSVRDEVDTEVRLIPLRAPTADEMGMVPLAGHLMGAQQGQVSMAGPRPLIRGETVWVRVESVLRLGSRVFVTLSLLGAGRNTGDWKREQFRLRARLEDGVQVELPLLLVSSPSVDRQRYTIVAPLPEQVRRLELATEARGAPRGFHPLPLGEEEPAP